jgi:MSHA biogenesis protein MshO
MYQRGLTLLELVIVIVILSVLFVGTASFIRSSVQSITATTDRGQLLNEARFAMQRIARELQGAIPNSIRVNKQLGEHCLEFVPFKWSSMYLDLPAARASDTSVVIPIVAPVDVDGSIFELTPGTDVAIVYPLRSRDIYFSNAVATELRKVREINACNSGDCSLFTDNVLELTLNNGFMDGSPAQRIYFASESVNFCVVNNSVVRFTNTIAANQRNTASNGGVILASNIENTLLAGDETLFSEDDPFQHFVSSRLRNAVVQIRLRFLLNGEIVTFQQEVHIPNAP